MEISKEARDRIFSAADSLYDHVGGAGNFPTVDAVRKLAKVNMNDANEGMREWRKIKAAKAAPVAVQVPDALQHLHASAMANLWHEAQELANESLRAAKAGWEAERLEAEIRSKQISDAYDNLSVKFDAVQQDALTVTGNLEQSDAMVRHLRAELEIVTVALTAAEAATVTAEARTGEIKHLAAELRSELDHAHQEVVQGREEQAALRQDHQGEIEALRAATAVQQARADDAVARAEAATAALRTELAATQAKADDAARTAAGAIESLRTELATVRGKADAAQESLQQERGQAAAELQRTIQQLDQVRADREQATQAANQAREDAATLRGKMEAITDQNSQLMQTLKLAQAKGGSNSK